KRLRNLDEDGNPCCRCKHSPNIPQNFFEDFEKLSDCAEEYEADITFIQALVWLKSATRVMKDISVEQFHLVFHKQWNDIPNKSKDSEICNQDTILEVEEHSNSAILLNENLERHRVLGSDLECTSPDLLSNVKHRQKFNVTQNQRHTKQNDEYITRRTSSLSTFSFESTQTHFRSFIENTATGNNCVISDSEREDLSCSDMFNDSIESKEMNSASKNEINNKLLDGNDLITAKSAVELPLLLSGIDSSWYNDSSQKVVSESKNDLSFSSSDDETIDLFNESCSLYKGSANNSQNDVNGRLSKTNTKITEQYVKMTDSHFSTKKPTVSSSLVDNVSSPRKDSAYDTYHLSEEHCVSLNGDENFFLNSKIDGITSYQRCNIADGLDFLDADMDEKAWISDNNRDSWLPSLKLSLYQKNDGSTDSIQTVGSICHDPESSQRNRWSQQNDKLMENVESKDTPRKKRKLESTPKTDSSLRGDIQEEKRLVPLQLLRFTLDALNTDDIAFQSMKVILSILRNDRVTRQYMRTRYWKNTLEMLAVDAVLNFCDIFETENKNNACTNEIVQVITSTLETSIDNTELNKVIVEYVFLQKSDNHSEGETIIPVVDLWKKQLKFEVDIVQESMQARERRWQMIFNEFSVIAVEIFVQFAEMSRRMYNLLT
ncbi:hypothetical protein WN55_03715, partial [Dufourea novaeangliae]